MKRFKDLKIGDKFHTGKSYGMGVKIQYWMEWEKIDNSHAKCVDQIGYGNTRFIGSVNCFSAMVNVWEI